MKLALFLCLTFWTARAAAQTTLTFVGSPNSDYRRFSAVVDQKGALWDFTAMQTEAGYQGIAGTRVQFVLSQRDNHHFSISPGIYAVFGDRKELFGSGLALGWNGDWKQFGRKRLGWEGLIVQYINPTKKSLSRYTIGEGEFSFYLRRKLCATAGGEMVHNHPHAPKSVAWGGGIAYHLEEWVLFARSRGHEVQLGLTWNPKKSH